MIVEASELKHGELPINRIVHGHVMDVLEKFPDNSIDLIIFSPPYYGKRSYGREAKAVWGGDRRCDHEWEVSYIHHDNLRYRPGQSSKVGKDRKREIYADPNVEYALCRRCGAYYGELGLEPDYRMYIDHMFLFFMELKRVLRSAGSIYMVIADSYSGSQRGVRRSIPRKSLMMIPQRIAIRLIDELGLRLRNIIVWEKLNPMPSSVKDRLTNVYEEIYHFTKSDKYYYDLDAIRIPPPIEKWVSKAGYGAPSQEFQRKFTLGFDEVRKLVKRELGDAYDTKYAGVRLQHLSRSRVIASMRRTSREVAVKLFPGDRAIQQAFINWVHDYAGHPRGKNPGDVISLATRPLKGEHYAPYPYDLLLYPILSSCPPNGIVLDPFFGSGSTAVAVELINAGLWDRFRLHVNEYARSIDWNIKWIGIEVVRSYCELAMRRLRSEVPRYGFVTLDSL